MHSLADSTSGGWYSIGLLLVGGEWRWHLSGSLTNKSSWADGHPKDNMRFAYMDFNNGGRWVSIYGHISTQVLPFCEKLSYKSTTKAVMTVTTTTEHRQIITDTECRWPWVQILKSCYLMRWKASNITWTEASSWEAGRRFCLDRGGYMLEVNSEEEQNGLTGDVMFLK